jgi:hypothetical protein
LTRKRNTTEAERITEIDMHLVPLLGHGFDIVEAPGVKSNGVITQQCGYLTAYPLVREIKNEIGTGNADPYNQASLLYRKYWAAPARKSG